MADAWREAQRNTRLKRVAHNPLGASKPESEFLIWIPCNPLKSPDFGRIKPNKTKLFCLDLFGLAWIGLDLVWAQLAFKL